MWNHQNHAKSPFIRLCTLMQSHYFVDFSFVFQLNWSHHSLNYRKKNDITSLCLVSLNDKGQAFLTGCVDFLYPPYVICCKWLLCYHLFFWITLNPQTIHECIIVVGWKLVVWGKNEENDYNGTMLLGLVSVLNFTSTKNLCIYSALTAPFTINLHSCHFV